MREKSISTVSWRRYLIPNDNERVIKFLESRGDDVFWQLSQNIHKCSIGVNKKNNLIIVVHENASSAIMIDKKDFIEVLDLAISWFQRKEKYEMCSNILKFKNDIKSNKIKKKREKTIKNLI